MRYEIRIHEVLTEGNTYNKTFVVDDYKVIEKNGARYIRFKKDGKKSYTYQIAEKRLFHKELEVVVAEATTGKVIETLK